MNDSHDNADTDREALERFTQPKRRLSWTITADCYADDETALREDALSIFYDGLLGGYALDVSVTPGIATDIGPDDD